MDTTDFYSEGIASAKKLVAAMDHESLQPGETADVTLIARDADMAKALSLSPDENFPEVLATSRMVALMELAAARLMKKLLQPHELSVGVGVNIRHLAATPNNTEVKAVATFLGYEGKLFKFMVEAFDPAGKVGAGEHTRAIIDSVRLLEGARKRFGVR